MHHHISCPQCSQSAVIRGQARNSVRHLGRAKYLCGCWAPKRHRYVDPFLLKLVALFALVRPVRVKDCESHPLQIATTAPDLIHMNSETLPDTSVRWTENGGSKLDFVDVEFWITLCSKILHSMLRPRFASVPGINSRKESEQTAIRPGVE